MADKKFHTRSFISFCLFIAIFWLLISGTVLYISPPGRVAHWQHWTFLGFNKDQWQAQHTIFSYAFVVIAVIHIFSLNWKNMWSYVKLKSRKGLRKKKELAVAVALSSLVFIGTTAELPPFSTFNGFGEDIGFSWEDQQMRAPMPHTENLSLEEVATKFLNIDSDKAITTLRNNGIELASANLSLLSIAIKNETSPSYIYSLIAPPSSRSGKGYGRMTVKEVAAEVGKDPDEILDILKSNGIEGSASSSIKDIAVDHDLHPSDIVRMLKIDH
jgi:hypothetical protein